MTRLGIVLYHGIDSGPELKEYGRIAEEAGFESLWVTERYFHEETFSLLGFLAAATQRIKLGVGVVNPYTRNPALLAMASATLDRISGGRFLLGLGRSEKPVMQNRMGIPYGDSRATLQEAVTLIRSLLSGERVSSASGRFKLNSARLATTPLQQKLPIYLAAIGAKGLRLAGAIADGVLLNAYVPPAYVQYAVQEIRQAAQEAGRDPYSIDVACMLVVRLTDEPDSLRPTLKQRIVRLLEEPYVGEILLEKSGFDPAILPPLRALAATDGGKEAVKLISDEMVDAFYVLGPADHCKERITAYRQAGVDLPLLLPRLEDYRKVAETLNQ
ncbi:MAG TPA: LLM class flavin-dependent oxidoreductase [Candidatus Binatia bacterium]|jgi:5,10-methylenetetrahydromethanopterin reductase|nr:LLM class flavin-dependent oxidoreductase [Candidatus Binatia bacterium]